MSMGGAIHSIISADASDYRAALASMESDTSRAVGRIGGIFKASTGGFREFAKGVGSIGAAFGTAFGAFHMGRTIRATLDVQEQINEAVVREVTLREGLLRRIEDEKRALDERLGLVESRGPNVAAVESATSGITAQIKEAEDRAALLRAELESLQSMWGEDASVFGMDLGGAGAIRAELGQIQETIADLTKARSEFDARGEPASGADAAARAAQDLRDRQQRVDQVESIARRLRIDGLRAEGRETEALRETENDRFLEELERITKLEAASGARYDSMRDDAQSFHQSELDRIGREAGARKRAMEQANELSGLDLDAQEAALSGDKERARALEEEIRKKRAIEEITRASGLSEAERAERIAQVERISAMRLADGDKAGGIESPTVGIGVQRNAGVLAQVFGGTVRQANAPAREETQQKQLTIVGGIMQTLETIVRDGLRTEARFA